jgi:hypothetical protein
MLAGARPGPARRLVADGRRSCASAAWEPVERSSIIVRRLGRRCTTGFRGPAAVTESEHHLPVARRTSSRCIASRTNRPSPPQQEAKAQCESFIAFVDGIRGIAQLPATGTDAAMAVDAGDGRADGRQLDMIVGMDVALIGGAEHLGAMRAGGQG